jgi:serpin B
MKRIFMLAAAAAAMLAMASCGAEYEKPAEGSQTGFALSFFKNVDKTSKPGENIVVSPYSAGVALSMVAEGAEGQTRVEFDNALNGCLFKAEDLGSNDTVVVKSANSVWVTDDFSIRNRYVSLLEKDFDAFITTLNFSDPATVKAINNWCAENTNGKIPEIIDRINPGTVMMLINALYFNAPWEDAFLERNTREGVFHGYAGDVQVPMMAKTERLNYAEYQGCQMVELPYQGGRYSMYVVLPAAGMGVDQMIPYINETLYDQAMGMMTPVKVKLTMPKFKLETSLVLNKSLQEMGIRTAFTSAADFKGIAEMGSLTLDQVKQKCYIEVSEKGTEAAAVTSVGVRLTSARPETMVTMNVDRPYLFFISDRTNGNILFAGKVMTL